MVRELGLDLNARPGLRWTTRVVTGWRVWWSGLVKLGQWAPREENAESTKHYCSGSVGSLAPWQGSQQGMYRRHRNHRVAMADTGTIE